RPAGIQRRRVTMPPVTMNLDGAEFPLTDLGSDHEAQALAEYSVCRSRERKLHKRLVAAASTKIEFRLRAHTYMSSPACAFVAMIEQAKRLPRWKRRAVSVYHDLSKLLTPFKPITEQVEFWYEPKASGNGH